ncbi:MAG TPA: trehalase family glycosidase, partial [Gemmatimonadales bacterium]|nr:trehalase family glycosidase [Gemmatimonadales bacterium]
EHRFWMDGAERLAPGQAYRRVVRLPDGSVLNRYWDDLPEPRPESYRPDDEVGQTLPPDRREAFYRNVRATAESGWDFSSRWMRDPSDLRTLETVDLLPVDLNSLLYHAERTIAALRAFRGRKGDAEVARRFAEAAERRRRSLLAAAWDPQGGFFYDVRWRTDERVSDRPTLAATAPLYFGLATEEQGRTVARQLERAFLKPGGFVTTLIASGQQWDAPNGWPPLEWLAIEGVRRYGSAGLADTAAARWLALNRRTWRATGRMMEKYDVEDLSRGAGGGEYPTQDGFGWTNGVALALGAQRASGTPRGDADRKAGKPRHQIERAAEGGDVGPERAHPGIAAALQSGDFGLGGLQPARQCCLGNPAEAPEAPQGFLRGERQPAQAALGQSPADLLLEPLLVSRPFRLLAPHPLLHPNPRLSGFPFSWTLVLSNH